MSLPDLAATAQIQLLPLSHSAPFESSAFLVTVNGASIVYLGDTGVCYVGAHS